MEQISGKGRVVLSTFGCLFSNLFFINYKKTTTVKEKRKCHRPPYFNYLSVPGQKNPKKMISRFYLITNEDQNAIHGR
jgi:hypothetical protein